MTGSKSTDGMLIINTKISNLERMMRFWYNHHHVRLKSKHWRKEPILQKKVFVSNKIKGLKQNRQNSAKVTYFREGITLVLIIIFII